MSSNCLQSLSFLLLLFALATPTLQIDWQGLGNMSESNMTEIHSIITKYPITSTTAFSNYDSKAQSISTELNTLWDPAWNVFIVWNQLNADTILYGYAFNNHWLWMNNVPIPGTSANVLAYIIWKDYNCHTWATTSGMTNKIGTFTAAQNQVLASYTWTGLNIDVWAAAFNFVEYLNTHNLFSSGAYSVVLSQNAISALKGYACVYNNNYYARSNLIRVDNVNYGGIFMIQTR